MKITEKNGIVKWETTTNEWFIKEIEPIIPLRMPESANVITAPEINPDWYYINEQWFHITKSLNDKEMYDDVYVNGQCLGPEGAKLVNSLLPMLKKINLLPKESTMRTRYVVVNLKDKVEFEKEWELSYGYNNCPKICFDQKEAIGWINRNLGPNEKKDYVVERHNAGKIDVVWKIDSLVGIQEEDEDEDF